MAISQYQLMYQVSPIFLTGGIANNIGGGILPVVSLTNTDAFTSNLLGGNPTFELDDAFAIFQPSVGGTLVEQVAAQYPFANLSVAANAIIRNPINVSMMMVTPQKQQSSWSVKQQMMTSLKQTLDSHNNAGGTYTVVTPAFIYTNMILLTITDVSIAQSPLAQNAWRWDFTRPLVSLQDVAGAMSNLMNQISQGVAPIGGGNVASPGGGTNIQPDPTAASGPTTTLTSPPSIVNTGVGAGATSPFVSQTPFVTNNSPSFSIFDQLPSAPSTPSDDPLGWSVTVSPNQP